MDFNWNKPVRKNWAAILFLTISPFLATAGIIWYIWLNGIHPIDIILFVTIYFLSGIGITAGYHRYYAHRTYDCHPIIQLFYLIFGGIAIQQPVLYWARNHRIHHRYADQDLDPHNINKGFFHAHMGWIFTKTELDKDFRSVPDLLKNKLVMWQNKYYWLLVFIVGVGLPAGLGWLVANRPFGGFLWGGLLRVVAQSHSTYSINSVAHTFGKQKFSLKSEARDSWLLALISNGEGFHSFHHRFASDYRNGWRWYHWDPSKWWIRTLAFMGLTKNLSRTPKAAIRRAIEAVKMQKSSSFQN